MVKFAHMADVHLGGWKQELLQDLNLKHFQKAIDICINEKVDFVLIAGDLFDSAFPPIEILKESFAEFRRLKDAEIPCFIIAGSHDYSVSGKTFLDVLEKAGFCKNVENVEEKDGKLILNPTIYQGVAIYGYPGRRAGLEIPELRKVKFNDAPGMFKIFMLHTTIDKARGNLPIDAIETDLLPEADYYALGHLHIKSNLGKFNYSGPLFPNNFQELEDLRKGSFYIVDTSLENPLQRVELEIKKVMPFNFEINDANTAAEKIILELDKNDIGDKIVLLRIRGEILEGKNSDIKFSQIEEFAKQKNVYFLLKNTHDLKTKEVELELDVGDTNNLEEETIKAYIEENPSQFNGKIPQLMNIFSVEKQEGETSESFEKRLWDESKGVMQFK
jgi:hypothetical protein